MSAAQPLAEATVAPRPSMPLQLEVLEDGSRFAAQRAEWNGLWGRSSAALFLRWEWLYSWWRRLGADRAPWVLRVRDPGGELAGLLPLGVERRRVGGVPVRRLAFLGETHVGSDCLDQLAPPERAAEMAQRLAEAVASSRAGWDVLDLLDLPPDSPLVPALVDSLGRAGLTVRVTPRYVCPYEPLVPDEPFEAFLRRTGRRDNYLRRRKWLEKQPGFRIEKTTVPAQLARPLAEFFRLHVARWEQDGGSQGIRGAATEAFHRDATWLLAETDALRLYTMWLGDTAVASVYGLRERARFLYFQSGYDPAWRNKSVGLVLVGETFRDAIAEGCREYDFLRGTESYKADWTTQRRETVALRAFAPGSRGAWLDRAEAGARGARNVVKKLLPTRAVERVRRWRRGRGAE